MRRTVTWGQLFGLIKEGARDYTKDFDLWKDWKDSGEDPDKLRPLLHQFKGMIRKESNPWKNVDIPPVVVDAEFNKQFLHAARTYNPNKGKLKTWVGHNLRRAGRFMKTYQNPARIVEGRSGAQRGKFNNAVAVLSQRYDRDPTTTELSEYLGWSPPEVERATAESRRALYTSSYSQGYDPASHMPSRATEIMRFMPAELSDEETLVWEYLLGEGGKPQLNQTQIAQRMGVSPSKVTRLKKSIEAKIKKHY